MISASTPTPESAWGRLIPWTVDDVRVVPNKSRRLSRPRRFLPSTTAHQHRQRKAAGHPRTRRIPDTKSCAICKFSLALFRRTRRTSAHKVGVVTEKLAQKLYGSTEAGGRQRDQNHRPPFTIVGTFKEGGQTFGQSEVEDNTVVIPYTVSRFLLQVPAVKEI